MRCAIILITLAVLPAIGFSATYYVPDDYSTIQGAISDASVVSGDTVIVRAGTYWENIDFQGKAITLQSEQGPGDTIINGNQEGSVVTCQSGEGPDSVLDGFTITNGHADGGGGMHNESSSPTVNNCNFTGNSASSHGGGMYNAGYWLSRLSSPTVTNCTFTENTTLWGGGMYNFYSDPTVTNCTFTGNSTTNHGGGMTNFDSSPTVTNCIFWNNTGLQIYDIGSYSATVTYSCVEYGYPGTGNIDADPLFVGGGDFHITSTSPCIDAGDNYAPAIPSTDCDGENRITDGDKDGTPTVDMGADELMITWYVPGEYPTIQQAIDAAVNSDTILVDSGTYVENIDFKGKAITMKSEQGPAVTIIDGYGYQNGSVVTCQSGEGPNSVLDGFTITNGSNSGMRNDNSSSPTVTNCIFYNNLAYHGGGMNNYNHCNPTVTNCIFDTNWSTNAGGGGMHNYNSSNPTVTDCTFIDNWTTSAGGGGMKNQLDSNPTVTNCTFFGNSAEYEGGGMQNYDHCSPTVMNCTFSGNSAVYGGGGMFNYNFSFPIVTNCVFAQNSAPSHRGGGMYNKYHGNATVTNCTFYKNMAVSGGGMRNYDACYPAVTNCIFWNDTPDEINNTGSSPTVTYSCVQGGYPGTGNIDADPLFADPGTDDFHLTEFSPCIDAGDNNAPQLPPTDFEGDPRILDGDGDAIAVVDMGCDEHIATYIYVPDNFSTIQDAVNASIDGCTIIVRAGNYVENIDFLGKAITLQSEQGPAVTTIDGNLTGSVVTCENGEGPDSVLDGFTITNGSGTDVSGYYYGGGIYNDGSSPTVTNCTFSGNSADYGGGMRNYNSSSPTVTNCTFSGNSADCGGGMYNRSYSDPMVTNCTFSGNSATWGGGMFNSFYSDPMVTNCTFSENSCFYPGGGMYNYDHCSPTVTNCTFTGNSAKDGGGMYNFKSNPTVTNCIFTGNSTTAGGGGGMCNRFYSDSTVTDCTFSGNSSFYEGGGMSNYDNCNPTVINCTFTGNSAPGGNGGGGMFNYNSSNPAVTNCTFTGNSGISGGGMSNKTSCCPTVTNCIFWNDTPDEINNTGSSPTVTYCCIQGGYSGTGNIDDDPLFVDPWNDDYHLTYASPCIDAGDNNAPSLPAVDFEGDPRIFPGNGKGVYLVGSPPQPAIVDMEADEYCLLKRQQVIPK